MEPWYKVVVPREEVRAGRSFNPDAFAIPLEPAVSRSAPDGCGGPDQLVRRTVCPRARSRHLSAEKRLGAGPAAGAGAAVPQ
jgi:hypothetical protein